MVRLLGATLRIYFDPHGRACVALDYTSNHARSGIAGAVATFFTCVVYELLLFFIALAVYSYCCCRRPPRRRRPRNERLTIADLAPATTLPVAPRDRPLGEISVAADGDDCVICLEELAAAGQRQVSVLPRCRHAFHTNCIDRWLVACRPKSTCPLCGDCVIERRRASDEFGDYYYYVTDDSLSA